MSHDCPCSCFFGLGNIKFSKKMIRIITIVPFIVIHPHNEQVMAGLILYPPPKNLVSITLLTRKKNNLLGKQITTV